VHAIVLVKIDILPNGEHIEARVAIPKAECCFCSLAIMQKINVIYVMHC